MKPVTTPNTSVVGSVVAPGAGLQRDILAVVVGMLHCIDHHILFIFQYALLLSPLN
jgi:hypothetical protein